MQEKKSLANTVTTLSNMKSIKSLRILMLSLIFITLLIFYLITSKNIESEFASVEKIEFFRGYSPNSYRVLITDKVAIDEIIDAIELNTKQSCRCAHNEGVIFYKKDEKIEASICSHCFWIFNKDYYMPESFYKLFKKYISKYDYKSEFKNIEKIEIELYSNNKKVVVTNPDEIEKIINAFKFDISEKISLSSEGYAKFYSKDNEIYIVFSQYGFDAFYECFEMPKELSRL